MPSKLPLCYLAQNTSTTLVHKENLTMHSKEYVEKSLLESYTVHYTDIVTVR